MSPLGQRKMGRETETERETLNKFKVVLCLGADVSHSSRNSTWIMLKISLYDSPSLLEQRAKLRESDYHTIIASL